MTSNSQKQTASTGDKAIAQQQPLPRLDEQDDRYPGTFFRVPGVPMPGKTTWSLAK